MLKDFLEGRCAVFLDKQYPDLIHKFHDAIYEYVKDFSYPWGSSLLDYFMSKGSGPYFFVEKRSCFNGGTLKFIVNSCIGSYSVEEFLNDLNSFEINEKEYTEMFI